MSLLLPSRGSDRRLAWPLQSRTNLPPPLTPATVRRYKSGDLISAPASAAKRKGATVTRRGLAASGTDTRGSADEGESEGESEGDREHKSTGDPGGSKDLQDIREMLDESEKPTE
jgi:hypothetical protein